LKAQVGKGTLLTIGIALLSLGLSTIKEGRIAEGIIICAIGLIVVIVFVYLSEKQAVEKALKLLKAK